MSLVCIYLYIYIYVCVCVCVYVCMYVCMYAYIYTLSFRNLKKSRVEYRNLVFGGIVLRTWFYLENLVFSYILGFWDNLSDRIWIR